MVTVLTDSVTGAEPGVADVGLSVQVAPLAGQPERLRLTGELNPASEAMVTEPFTDWPCWTVNEDGAVERLKSGVAGPRMKDPINVLQEAGELVA